MTVEGLLRTAQIDSLEARILLAHALDCTRVQLVIRAKDELTPQQEAAASELFARRRNGEPIAYLTGEREFYGLSFNVTPDVLIPRHETELLVELALDKLPKYSRVLDLGTGSGAIAVSIAHARADAHVTATDASEAALEVARRNAAKHNVNVRFLLSDWYCAIDDRFDLIVSNPPYIAAGDPHLSQGDLRFEPAAALTDNADGLTDLAAIIDGAPLRLQMGGWLLIEHGHDQAAAVRALLERAGWQQPQSWRDLAGIERVTGAQRPVN